MSDSDFVGYNPDALQYLPDLNALFAGLDAETSAKVSQVLYAGLVTGTNPNDLVSSLVDCVSPARALVIARTEMLGAYRSAALDAYRANSDVVGQWMWVADLIGACISCIEEDGTLHDLDEDMDGMTHPACRCSPVPVTASWADILGPLGIDASDITETSLAGANFVTGDEWFAAQGAATQREILGPAAYNAWQAGDLHLVDLIGEDGSVNSLKSLGLDFRDYLDRNIINLDEAAAVEAAPETAAESAAQYDLSLSSAGRERINEWFGQDLSDSDLAGLVGGRPGDTITFTLDPSDDSQILIHLQGDSVEADRVLWFADGEVHMTNEGITVDEAMRGQGIGTDIFSRQVETLQRLGVREIETNATGLGSAYGEENAGNGFYTWARLGYDGDIPWPDLKETYETAFGSELDMAEVPASVRDARTIQDLMQTPEGREWWAQYGVSFDGAFDLTPGSRSMQTLDDYLREKGLPGVNNVPFATSRVANAGYRDITASYDLTAEDKTFVNGLKDQIAALDQGSLTASQVMDIGRQLNERIEADLADFRRHYEEAKEIRTGDPALRSEALQAWMRGDKDAMAAHGGVSWVDAAARYQAEYQARVASYLSEIRDMGGLDVRLDMTGALADQRVADAIQGMQDAIPRDWLSAGNDLGDITPVKNRERLSGGWFEGDASGDGKIALSYTHNTNEADFASMALHEMMHRMEQAIPELSNLETDFYIARTAGETAVPLRNGIRDMTKLDQWRDEYLGRAPIRTPRPAYQLANGDNYYYVTHSYELLSLGAEMLLGGGSTYELIDLRQDQEFVSFILGLFAALEG